MIKYRAEKGVSLITLGLAIIILIIITNILIYNAKDSVQIEKITNLYNDIDLLSEKISTYYSEKEELPIDILYENTNNLPKTEKDEKGQFYVIDLEKLEGVTLNYGRDYDSIKQTQSQDLEDIYIMNNYTHNIFYVKGVQADGKIYYTNEEELDNVMIDLRNVEGIKIPKDYIYIGKDNNENIQIQEKSGTNKYIWTPIAYTMTKEEMEKNNIKNINTAEIDDFIISVNKYNGYFKNVSSDEKIYIKLEESDIWSLTYENEEIYVDENGQKAYIPKGFKVNLLSQYNQIKNGLVVMQESTKNEYVWIPVSKSITANAENTQQIEEALKNYAKEYTSEGYTDEWYDGCGLSQEEYNKLKEEILNSIKENGGFYISRYEAGSQLPKASGSYTNTAEQIIETFGNTTSVRNKYPYNYINCNQAQKIAQEQMIENKTTSILFGIQWDLICKFIEKSNTKTLVEIKEDSTEIGNYKNSTFKAIQGRYTNNPDDENQWTEVSVENGYEKNSAQSILFTTGSTNKTEIQNIYDLAGNIAELTLEKSNQTETPCTIRGGSYIDDTKENTTLSQRSNITEKDTFNNVGFRITIF